MKRAAFMLAGWLLAWTATAQDLTPEVLLLSRIEIHTRDEFQRLSTISCLETVRREEKSPKGRLRPLDTVRLEVLTDGDKEMFSSPGDRKFSDQPPLSFAGSGMLGNGLFGPYLKNILLNGNAATKYIGEEDLSGRRVARFDYRLAPAFSGQTIDIVEGSGTVGLHGSFWADPKTFDVVRLDLKADNIPDTLPLAELITTIKYGRTVLGNRMEVLLPETADVRLVKQSGEISRDQVEFTHCRVFGAESTLAALGSTDTASAAPAPSADEMMQPLPAGLQVAVNLRTRISIDMAVGTLIDGVVAGDVKEKRDVIIPAGSLVRGRIRRLERYSEPVAFFVIGIEFTEVEVAGMRHLFYADLVDLGPAVGVELSLTTGSDSAASSRNNTTSGTAATLIKERIVVHNLPGVATFFVRGTKLDLPDNFRTVWKTRALKK